MYILKYIWTVVCSFAGVLYIVKSIKTVMRSLTHVHAKVHLNGDVLIY